MIQHLQPTTAAEVFANAAAVRKRAVLTFDIVSKLLSYNPETGKLYWLERSADFFRAKRDQIAWNARYAGMEALTSKNGGHLTGWILGGRYLAHRICWLLHYGSWPSDQIDHINGVKDDNRIVNLRDVPNAENGKNQKRRSNNTSGVTGVFWSKLRQKWRAEIRGNGINLHLGLFSTFEEAATCRKEAEFKYGYHKNHGRAGT